MSLQEMVEFTSGDEGKTSSKVMGWKCTKNSFTEGNGEMTFLTDKENLKISLGNSAMFGMKMESSKKSLKISH